MRQRSQIGYNLAALKFIKRQEEDARTAEFYEQGGQGGRGPLGLELMHGQEWAEDEIKTLKEQIQNGANTNGTRKRKRVGIKA